MRDGASETPLSIGTAVSFEHGGETVHGHLLRHQGRRRYATVIDVRERTWRIPEAALETSGRARRATMVTRHDEERAAWRTGDEATFSGPDGPMRGTIVKLNLKTARVRCGETHWNVPWGLLRGAARKDARDGAGRLKEVADRARRLMDEHGLTDWTFAFLESGRRLGDCRYRDRVIRVGRAHALEGNDAQIRDTVLHEIAHALAGPGAGHGPVWKAIARRIGARPKARAPSPTAATERG